MFGWILASALLGAGEGEAVEELAQLCKPFQEVENYTFSTRTESSGGGFGRDGGQPDAPDAPPPTVLVGQYVQDTPVHLSQGELEAFVDDGQVVYKSEEDGWTTLDRESMRRGFGRGRGGGEAGGEPEGEDAGARRDRRGNDGARPLFRLTRVRLPHELLKEFETKVTDVVRTEAEGRVTYSGKLTEEGVRALSTFGGRGGRGGRGGGPDLKLSGTFEFSLDDQGQLSQLVFHTTTAGSFGDRDFERSSKQTIELSKIGQTQFEIPEEALSKFEL